MGAKWSRAHALLLCKEKLGLLEGLVLEVLEGLVLEVLDVLGYFCGFF
jgi:hypothetical protein